MFNSQCFACRHWMNVQAVTRQSGQTISNVDKMIWFSVFNIILLTIRIFQLTVNIRF